MKVSFQLITIHYISTFTNSILHQNCKKSLQLITIHYNSLQSITFHYKFVHVFVTILVKPLQFITIYYNPLQSITIHYNWLNPHLNPYLLAPPILETVLWRTKISSYYSCHYNLLHFSLHFSWNVIKRSDLDPLEESF